MLESYTKFNDAQVGSTLNRPVLLVTYTENVAKNGKTFLKCTLKDGSDEINANYFDKNAAALETEGLSKGCVADVKLKVGEYNGSKSFTVNEMSPTRTALTPNDFVKLPPVPLDKMYEEICAAVEECADDCGGKYLPISQLALDILTKYKDGYMSSSAAVSMHHNLKGGLLYHSYRMVKAAQAVCTVYTELDKELLVCAAAIHDIGKLWEYNTTASGDAEVTSSGVLFGHIYLGANLIKSTAAGRNFNMEKIQLLVHMILSHHGTREWGAVVCPATAEAYALHYLDNLDAKIYTCTDYYEKLDCGSFTDKKPFGLENRIYRPKEAGACPCTISAVDKLNSYL